MSTTLLEHRAPAADQNTTIGLAHLMGMAYRREDMTPIWTELAARIDSDPADAAALMDLSTILLLTGQRERGLHFQQVAIGLSAQYRRPHGTGKGMKLLALVTHGDFMANTPLDFLLQGSDVELTLLYVNAARSLPDVLPEHDVCFLAIGESTEAAPLLARLGRDLANWPRPVVNGAADRIAALTRDGVYATFAQGKCVLVADTVRFRRDALTTIGNQADLTALFPGVSFPIIARPIGSHAGAGMAKLDTPEALQAYLEACTDDEIYLAPFIDYRSADGLYRKQRIAFIGGKPFISHMAISEHWMVHYLSAGMEENAEKRAEEGRFFEAFDTDFAVRHAQAFENLHRHIGLDYFGIDCAELPDGRLLVFEVDVAMIVHLLDSEALYPYKKPAMIKLFQAFQQHLER